MKRLTYSGTKEAKPNVTIREIVEKLTEYEDLEEQGKLLIQYFKESKSDVTIREVIERLTTEYDDLVEQGALLKLTCKCTGCIYDKTVECMHCMRAYSDCYESV